MGQITLSIFDSDPALSYSTSGIVIFALGYVIYNEFIKKKEPKNKYLDP